jgi:hypothetical protein
MSAGPETPKSRNDRGPAVAAWIMRLFGRSAQQRDPFFLLGEKDISRNRAFSRAARGGIMGIRRRCFSLLRRRFAAWRASLAIKFFRLDGLDPISRQIVAKRPAR